MFKIILSAGIIALLAACSGMPWDSASRSSGTSDASTMGGPGSMGMNGAGSMSGNYGPLGASGGGPN